MVANQEVLILRRYHDGSEPGIWIPERCEDLPANAEVGVSVVRALERAAKGTGGLPDLVGHLGPGGWLAFQVPGNFAEPSHTIRRDLAAEVLLCLAQLLDLRVRKLEGLADRSRELHASCAPCAMCLGAIHWSGVVRLVCGATREDAESLGFDEGPVFDESYSYLERHGIEVVHGIRREEAADVMQTYLDRGGPIYNP